MTYCRRPSLPAPPLEDDDLLSEILLRLPQQPSSLPRASLTCKGWRRLVSDPGFLRRFRAHHRRSPPILGFFIQDMRGLSFTPTLDPPNRVPLGRFSLQFDDGDNYLILGCRHGLVLIRSSTRLQVLVWDPVTGDQRRLAVPPGFGNRESTVICNGAVLRAAGDVHGGCHSSPFRVVLVGTDNQYTRAFACVYSSETGMWGNLISTPLPSKESVTISPTVVSMGIPSTLVGDSLYWLLVGHSPGILEFDLDRQSLAVIEVPMDMYADGYLRFWVMPAEGGGLGFLFLSDFSAQLWKRKTNCDGVASWVLGNTIELDKLLSLSSEEERVPLMILGFADDNNVVFIWTVIGVFMVQLESMQFKKLFEPMHFTVYHPFATVYTTGSMPLHRRVLLQVASPVVPEREREREGGILPLSCALWVFICFTITRCYIGFD